MVRNYDVIAFFQNIFVLRRSGVAIFADIIKTVAMFIKTTFKDSRKVKKIMYLNGICFCISWYRKICWFPVKKCWCQQNPRGVSCDSYSFWNFFRYGITVLRFIIVGYVWQILRRDLFASPPSIREQPILNRFNDFLLWWKKCVGKKLENIPGDF